MSQHPLLSPQSATHSLSDVGRIQAPVGGGGGELLAGGEGALALELALALALVPPLPRLPVGVATYFEHVESSHEPIDDMGFPSIPSITTASLDTPATVASVVLNFSALLLNETSSVATSNMIWRIAGSEDGNSEDSSKGGAALCSQPPPSEQQFPGVVYSDEVGAFVHLLQ